MWKKKKTNGNGHIMRKWARDRENKCGDDAERRELRQRQRQTWSVKQETANMSLRKKRLVWACW